MKVLCINAGEIIKRRGNQISHHIGSGLKEGEIYERIGYESSALGFPCYTLKELGGRLSERFIELDDEVLLEELKEEHKEILT